MGHCMSHSVRVAEQMGHCTGHRTSRYVRVTVYGALHRALHVSLGESDRVYEALHGVLHRAGESMLNFTQKQTLPTPCS